MKTIPVIILGLGGVGRALIRQLVAGRQVHAERADVRFAIVGLSDSKSILSREHGLDDNELLQILAKKELGQRVSKEVKPPERVIEQWLDSENKGIVVDVTATDATTAVLQSAVDAGWSAVLANKKPLAGSLDSAMPFIESTCVRYESTVGAGQPVIATLQYLLDTNDGIQQIDGQLSGSLGFICTQLDQGISFSTALQKARDNGFTEPDPREDLGGRDVMRKAIILARTMGIGMSEEDVQVESLYPPEMAGLDVESFMNAAEGLDAMFAARVAEAAASGNVLRYLASITPDKAVVGLQPVPARSSLANLKYVSFTTDRYDDEPLIIAGKGAGAGITAAGVVGDMIKLAKLV